jgi:hypothetical protein
MERNPWHVAYSEVEPYVVKIITPQGSGTGFLVASTEDSNLVGIATAAHVIDYAHYWAQPIRIQHFKSGKTVYLNAGDRFIKTWPNRDLASIVLQRGDLPFPANALPLISEDKCMKVGTQLGWVGFPAIATENLCFFSGDTSCWVPDGEFYFVDGVAINGVSGGPAFCFREEQIELIGVVSAYVPNRATGTSLPGLCVVRDVTPLYETVKGLRNLDDAKAQEISPPGPPPPYLDQSQQPPSGAEPTGY